jgi:hypothetical protein
MITRSEYRLFEAQQNKLLEQLAVAETQLASARKALEQMQPVFEAAHGLCMGYDWNNGTHAKLHGYRHKLLSAVHSIKEVPDFDGKLRAALQPDGDGK